MIKNAAQHFVIVSLQIFASGNGGKLQRTGDTCSLCAFPPHFRAPLSPRRNVFFTAREGFELSLITLRKMWAINESVSGTQYSIFLDDHVSHITSDILRL